MDKQIIRTLHSQWEAIKEQMYDQCEQRGWHDAAKAYRSCNKFRGNETLEQLASLYKSPQGIEFAVRHHFPNITTLRAIKREEGNLERFGIYIDAGVLTLDEPKGVVMLVGRTTAVVNCSELRRYQIVCLHGARVIVNASKWAVVRVDMESGCNVVRNISDNAIILQ